MTGSNKTPVMTSNVLGRLSTITLSSRTVCIFQSLFLQVIHVFWEPIPSLTLWRLSEGDHNLVFLALLVTHLLCWFLIASSIFSMDYHELMGFKQVRERGIKPV